MDFIRHSTIDWEALRIRFLVRAGISPVSLACFRAFFTGWLDIRHDEVGCHCEAKEWFFDSGRNEDGFEGFCRWMCDKCLTHLASAVGRRFPEIERMEIGFESRDLEQPEPGFVGIPQKVVETETGERHQVHPFRILQRPVTIGMFELFVTEMQYVTTAEMTRDDESFRENCAVAPFSAAQRMTMPATFLSYRDAVAYCEWGHVKLPSEEQWLAAALLQQRIVDETEYHTLLLEYAQQPCALAIGDAEMTSTVNEDGLVVVRRGPRFVRSTGWRHEYTYNRQLIPQDYYDMSLSFRVCSPGL